MARQVFVIHDDSRTRSFKEKLHSYYSWLKHAELNEGFELMAMSHSEATYGNSIIVTYRAQQKIPGFGFHVG